jgi:hypothetical protein
VGRGGARRTHLCGPPGVPRRALLSLCRRRQRPRALLLRTDAEVLRTAASPTLASPTGSTRPTSVPFWKRPTRCKPAKEIGEERAPSTPAIPSSGVYIILLDEYSSMSPIAKHTALRFVRHKPWLFRFGALRLLRSLVVILSVGYPSVVPSFLPFCLLFVVLVRSGCWCVA